MNAIAVALCVMLLAAPGVLAQTTSSSSASQVDPDKLPVSIGRIRLKLATPAERPSLLKFERIIEGVGVAPPIELWNPAGKEKMLKGPTPYGAPTQKDILDVITPQEFKRYPVDLNALVRWLAEKLGESSTAPAQKSSE